MARRNPYRKPDARRLWREIQRLTGVTYREAQLVLMQLRPWLDIHGERLSLAALRRHPAKLRELLALVRGLVPAGRPVEVTLTTKGGTYERVEDGRTRRRTDLRPLEVKVILVATRDLAIGEHQRMLQRLTETGIVPEGWKLVGRVDWKKGEGAAMNAGALPKRRLDEMVNFWGASHYPRTKIRAEMLRGKP